MEFDSLLAFDYLSKIVQNNSNDIIRWWDILHLFSCNRNLWIAKTVLHPNRKEIFKIGNNTLCVWYVPEKTHVQLSWRQEQHWKGQELYNQSLQAPHLFSGWNPGVHCMRVECKLQFKAYPLLKFYMECISFKPEVRSCFFGCVRWFYICEVPESTCSVLKIRH